MGSVGGSFRYRIAVGLGIHSVISIGIDIGISSASSPHRVIGSSRMERFVRVSASAGSLYEPEADSNDRHDDSKDREHTGLA